jgi:hypothetical protein
MDRNVRQISKRKVLYIDLDEEITSVFERIERLNYDDVYLVIPERAALFQSVVNLSILKKKVEEIGKGLSIITKDPIGMRLAHKAEIPVFDQLSAPEKPEKEEEEEFEEDNLFNTQPISAVSNEVEEERPERLTKKKISIFDIVREKKGKTSLSLTRVKHFLEKRKEAEMFREPSKFAMGAPSRKSMGALVVASLVILLLISYVALPGATVTVTPEFNVIEQSVNITFANASVYGTDPSIGSSHTIAYYPIDMTIENSLTYTSTGQIFGGTNAGGYVTFFNERETSWPLVALTRIQNEDGIVFRIQESVTIPSGGTDGPGTAQAYVVADEQDAYGRVSGERANIEPNSFVLPGLREASQKDLYARSDAPMTGGTTSVTLKVSQEDLNASEALLAATLENSVEDELEAEVTRRNTLNETNLDLLTGWSAFEIDDPYVATPTHLLEALQDEFEVTGSIEADGIAFDHDEFVRILEKALNERKSPDKQLIKIDQDSISYEIVEKFESPGQVKITATIKGIEAYDINPETESGAKLVKKIKEHIAGKQIKEAEDYVQNLSEINKVKISSWPMWAPTIPTVLENIEVKVDEEWLESFRD